MKSTIEIFTELAVRLRSIPSSVVAEAVKENGWFCQIPTALDAICSKMLSADLLQSWLDRYPIVPHTPKRVAIIMAGNIPAVGFADLLYVIAAGDIPVVKYSSKDRVLMEYIVGELKSIEQQLTIVEYSEGCAVDAAIATGSDTAALHFSQMFGSIPTLIRGSRHSVAVLTGRESSEELQALERDIFTYSGLGCRNVSLVFAPEGFDFTLSVPQMPTGYRNNYTVARAVLTMQGAEFTDLDGAIAVECREPAFPRHISCINICRYTTLDTVKSWLEDNNNRLQCVVSSVALHPATVPLGEAQYPALDDYADRMDVMEFLIGLHKLN